MCHENEMGAAKEQHPYIICRLDKQRRWNSGGTVTRPLFIDCKVIFNVLTDNWLAVLPTSHTPFNSASIFNQ